MTGVGDGWYACRQWTNLLGCGTLTHQALTTSRGEFLSWQCSVWIAGQPNQVPPPTHTHARTFTHTHMPTNVHANLHAHIYIHTLSALFTLNVVLLKGYFKWFLYPLEYIMANALLAVNPLYLLTLSHFWTLTYCLGWLCLLQHSGCQSWVRVALGWGLHKISLWLDQLTPVRESTDCALTRQILCSLGTIALISVTIWQYCMFLGASST